MNNKYVVYMHKNRINNKVYIGITSQSTERRWRGGNGYPSNKYFTNSILKYGWENFEHSILYYNLTQIEAEKKEIELIEKYKSNIYEFGYNQTKGGDGVRGYICSEETKRKFSEYFSGVNNPFYGRKHTEETKIKISKALKGKLESKNNPHSIPIICIETGKIYDCILDASIDIGIDNSYIGKCCKETYRTTHGLHFMYLDDYNKGEILKEKQSKNYDNPSRKKIICIESGTIYDNTTYAAQSINADTSKIYDCCLGKIKSVNSLHWQFLDDYQNGKKIDMDMSSDYSIKVKCLENNKIYNSSEEACKLLGINSNHILEVCRGIFKTCGKLHWEFA